MNIASLTHNKMYMMPVLNEIKEEIKSENSESKPLTNNNKSQKSSLKKSSAIDAKKVDFNKGKTIDHPNQHSDHKLNTIKVIASKL